jgi:2-dehydropantoate 2-reductase
VVHGAGGIGGVIAARLHQSGHDVVAIARGAHLEAWRANGLRLQSPDEDVMVDVPVVGHPRELELDAGDVVLLTMKGQDTVGALTDLAALAPPDIAVVCVQNGVANELEVLRRFERAYGVCVMFPTNFVEPGIVQAQSAPTSGILDIGRYPRGTDETADAVAAAFRASTFESNAVPDIMRFKYAKLLMNLGNAVQAVCGQEGAGSLFKRVRTEGVAALDAAGIERASEEEDRARRADHITMRPIAGSMRGGGSSWQSLARGVPSIEADHLNGEIVLLGRLHGVPTPVNALVQRLANHAARAGRRPGFMTPAEVEALLPPPPG